MTDRAKTPNEHVYYSIDAIHEAISTGRKINFKYFDYDIAKKPSYRRDGTAYMQTPLAMCWADDNYYLICYNAKYDALTHYRVDRMDDVTVSDEKADTVDNGRFNVAEHAKKVFGMFTGEMVKAELEFDKSLMNVVLDRFGKEVSIHKGSADGRFRVRVEVSTNPVFLAWMFGFGTKAKIIGPESLLKARKKQIAKNAGNYS